MTLKGRTHDTQFLGRSYVNTVLATVTKFGMLTCERQPVWSAMHPNLRAGP